MGLVFLIESGSERDHVAALEGGDLDGAPAPSRADCGGERELEPGRFAEGVGDDVQARAPGPRGNPAGPFAFFGVHGARTKE